MIALAVLKRNVPTTRRCWWGSRLDRVDVLSWVGHVPGP
jgi:hypothetical protein